ncbi:DNA translocase FtsK [Blastopirellula marina]|uniref:DNA translocase FtsK n=1 Tax=Blastopirellula marina TaxID=124 RepID=A0A2S8EYR6_9BACT|nr:MULTISPECIES: DNA translocase FtsK [Pirellulaceae]PQO25037.1 DNA translocase FtsK [Blastopirellula marina]RCS40889.1 DNA translocase FtsK [Bremerella cremea]
MFEERSIQRDLIAIGLSALTIFLALSLLSYRADDAIGELPAPFSAFYQPDQVAYPQPHHVHNLCGGVGALAADFLLVNLGIGAYFAVVSMAAFDVILLMRKEISSPAARLIGWLMTLTGITTLVTIVAPGASPGPISSSGGRLGLIGQQFLSEHFATTGAVILCLAVTACGVLLCTEYELVRLTVWSFLKAKEKTQAGAAAWKTRRERLKEERKAKLLAEFGLDGEEAECEYEEEAEFDEKGVRIKIGGRQIKTDVEKEIPFEDGEEVFEEEAAGDEEVEEEEEYEEEEEIDEEVEEELEEEEVEEEVPITRIDKAQESSLAVKNRNSKKQQHDDARKNVMSELDSAANGRANPKNYELPPIELLIESDDFSFEEQEREVRQKAKILEKTFLNFGFNVKVVEIETGPVIAQYEVELEAGLRLSKITGLADDLAIALRVPSVRIVAPIPGKNTVGIEVPNEERQMVRLREVMEEASGRINKMKVPIFLGKDVSGNSLAVDLASLPHLLIAGRTGTGKSVCLNALITSILMTRRPDEVRMLMIDPKMVELSCYRTLPHLMHPVVTDMKKAEAILAWAVEKMEERYQLLAQVGVRHLSAFNALGEEEIWDRMGCEDEGERNNVATNLPYIVIVADEIADMMMTAGKEVEQHIIRLAQKSRAVGIHLILATQKPTVDVITGLIKSNLPARISFQVASRTDSRVVLDEMGADKLLGNGDMLFLWPGTSTLMRGQGTYLSDEEINRVVEFVSTGEQDFVKELVQLKVEDGATADPAKMKKRDDLYEQAVDVIVAEQRGSVSLLQRALGVGYGRGARLIDFMAEDGIVGPYNGSQAREVIITPEEWELMKSGQSTGGGIAEEIKEEAPAPKAKRSNKIRPHVIEDEEEEEEVDEEAEYEEYEEGEEEAEYEEEEEAEYEEEEYEEEDAEYEEEEDEEEYEEEDDEEEGKYYEESA